MFVKVWTFKIELSSHMKRFSHSEHLTQQAITFAHLRIFIVCVRILICPLKKQMSLFFLACFQINAQFSWNIYLFYVCFYQFHILTIFVFKCPLVSTARSLILARISFFMKFGDFRSKFVYFVAKVFHQYSRVDNLLVSAHFRIEWKTIQSHNF